MQFWSHKNNVVLPVLYTFTYFNSFTLLTGKKYSLLVGPECCTPVKMIFLYIVVQGL